MKEKLTAEEEKILEKYGFDYADVSDKGERASNLSRQRYMFTKLTKGTLEDTAIEKLLDLTSSDLERLNSLKVGIESKTGFLLALWGILITMLLGNENIVLTGIKTNILTQKDIPVTLLIILALLVSCIGSAVYIYRAIKPRLYKSFMFNEKECNFKSAVDDKNITYITLFFAIVIIASHIWFVFTGGGVWI